MRSTAWRAAKARIATMVVPALKFCVAHHRPPTWNPGMPISAMSPARQSIQSSPSLASASRIAKKLRWASTTPLGSPVVPLV